MATAFDRWEKDPFFYAAEEVQESTDRMESVYQRWMIHQKKLAGSVADSCTAELRLELHTALGTAKWQLEEVERAVRASDHTLSAGEAILTRHRDFIEAISIKISLVEKALKELNIEEDGGSALAWVRLDEGEMDELALFLSCPKSEVEKVLPIPSAGCHEVENRMNGETSVFLNNPCSSNDSDPLEMEESMQGHRRVASACADSGVWKISVSPECSPRKLPDEHPNLPPPRIPSRSELRTVEAITKPKWYRNGFRKWKALSHEDMEESIPWQSHSGVWKISVSTERSPRKLSDEQPNLPPPRIPSLSELRTEAVTKPKWYRNGFRKWKALSHEDMEESIPLQNHQLSRGMHVCYEKSKSCLSDCTNESYDKQIYGWLGAFQRQIQRSQYQIQYGRPIQMVIWTSVTVLLMGGQVMVSTRTERLPQGPAAALNTPRISPYTILKDIRTSTHELDIPSSMGKHFIFSVEDLTPCFEPHECSDPYHRDSPEPSPWPPPIVQATYDPHPPRILAPSVPLLAPPIPPDPPDSELRAESVTKIFTHQPVPSLDDAIFCYLVCWRGRPFSGNTWIPAAELERLTPRLFQYGHLHPSEMNDFQSGGLMEISFARFRRKAGSTYIH